MAFSLAMVLPTFSGWAAAIEPRRLGQRNTPPSIDDAYRLTDHQAADSLSDNMKPWNKAGQREHSMRRTA
ncbi:MAG: hypothetical protein ACK41X_02125 [Pseudorhodoplanes sp.]